MQEQGFDREIKRDTETRARMLREGKIQGARLFESKIANLEKKKEKRLFELDKAKNTTSDPNRIVAVGIIKVI